MPTRQQTLAPAIAALAPDPAGAGGFARRCVSPHCCRHAGTGALGAGLCGLCRDDLDQELRDLPDLYAALARTAGRTRLSARTVEVRAAIRGVLASWAQVVVDERTVSRPIRDVAAMAEFLRRHVDWFGAHPAAAELASEVDELVTSASQLTGECADPRDLMAWLRPFETA